MERRLSFWDVVWGEAVPVATTMLVGDRRKDGKGTSLTYTGLRGMQHELPRLVSFFVYTRPFTRKYWTNAVLHDDKIDKRGQRGGAARAKAAGRIISNFKKLKNFS